MDNERLKTPPRSTAHPEGLQSSPRVPVPRAECSSQNSLEQSRLLARIELEACLFEFDENRLNDYLPFVPDNAYVNEVIQSVLQIPSHSTFFKPVSQAKPESISETHLRKICEVIQGSPYHGRSLHATFQAVPNKSTQSDILGSTFRSDFLFVLEDNISVSERKDLIRAPGNNGPNKDIANVKSQDVAVFGEIKPTNSTKDMRDNRNKLVGAATHYFCNDPARQFFLRPHLRRGTTPAMVLFSLTLRQIFCR